jgi:hypothetical protein
MQSLYSYLGYEYRPWDDVEEDNIKTYHECYKNGIRVKMPREFYNHSPYKTMTFAEFVQQIQTVEVFAQG